LRELPKKPRWLLKLRLLLKPPLVPVIFLLVFFLVAGFIALTQETKNADNPNHNNLDGASFPVEEGEAAASEEAGIMTELTLENLSPRWFRSNAGGMAIEENPSRLGALNNEYALFIDYVPPEEMEPRLAPFYKDQYIIETRILFKERKEIRRQWLLRDEAGNIKVNAVFRAIADEAVPDEGEPVSAAAAASMKADIETEIEGASSEEEAAAQAPDTAPVAKAPDNRVPSGFIEVYNENSQITRDFSLFEDGGEILTEYTYKEGVLITAETKTRDPYAGEYRKTHTDNYKYNRSYFLRYVERIFHEAPASLEAAGLEPVRLVFPSRVMNYDKDFIKEKLTFTSDFFGNIQQVSAGFRIVYDTDSKGRVLVETLYNERNEVVWTLKNTWVGDRISSILKIEGGNKKLIEFEYDKSGNRIAERDILNGVLERKVLINGVKETEELYLNGVVVMRAFWEDGRKISEERVRQR